MPLEMLAKGAPSTVKARAKRFACGVFDRLSQNAAWLRFNSIFKITVVKRHVFSTQTHASGKETPSPLRAPSDFELQVLAWLGGFKLI